MSMTGVDLPDPKEQPSIGEKTLVYGSGAEIQWAGDEKRQVGFSYLPKKLGDVDRYYFEECVEVQGFVAPVGQGSERLTGTGSEHLFSFSKWRICGQPLSRDHLEIFSRLDPGDDRAALFPAYSIQRLRVRFRKEHTTSALFCERMECDTEDSELTAAAATMRERLDDMTILARFASPTPRKLSFKRDSFEEGSWFDPWGWRDDVFGCSGIVMGILLLLALIPVVRTGALVGLLVLGVPVGLLTLGLASESMKVSSAQKRFGGNGIAVLGDVTRILREKDKDYNYNWRVTLEYRFRTLSGQEITGKQSTIHRHYDLLWQKHILEDRDTSVVVVYLPDHPEKNEPYASLIYEVCE